MIHDVKIFVDKIYRTTNIAGISVSVYGWCALLCCKQNLKKIGGKGIVTYQENIDLKIISEGITALKSQCNVTIFTKSKDAIDIIQHKKDCYDECIEQLEIIEGFMGIHKVEFIDISSGNISYEDEHLMRLATSKATEEANEYISDLIDSNT